VKILDSYLGLQECIFEYFGYVEDWRVLPIEDSREHYWTLTGGEKSVAVRFAETKDNLTNCEGDYYEHEIYTNRHLPKWVYRGDEYTMICVDTRVDGNKFLQIFSNSKEETLVDD